MIAAGATAYAATLALVMRLAGGRWWVLAASAVFVGSALWWASSLPVLALLALITVALGTATVLTPGRADDTVTVVEVES